MQPMNQPDEVKRPQAASAIGLIVIQRLHRMVRHGFRPWLGYDAASQQDRTIHLRRKRDVATLSSDGTVAGLGTAEIPGEDAAAFDALFPPNTPNRRNLTRRLYELGL